MILCNNLFYEYGAFDDLLACSKTKLCLGNVHCHIWYLLMIIKPKAIFCLLVIICFSPLLRSKSPYGWQMKYVIWFSFRVKIRRCFHPRGSWFFQLVYFVIQFNTRSFFFLTKIMNYAKRRLIVVASKTTDQANCHDSKIIVDFLNATAKLTGRK